MYKPALRNCFGFGAALATATFAAALVPATPAQAIFFGENACYEVTIDNQPVPGVAQFIRYVATPQGRLTTYGDLKTFGHPIQTTYTVHGKTTFVPNAGSLGDEAIAIVDGAAIVGRSTGAVLAIQRDFLDQEGDIFFDKIDCTSENGETSATPQAWLCELIIVIVGANPIEGSDLRLARVNNTLAEPACSDFTLEDAPPPP